MVTAASPTRPSAPPPPAAQKRDGRAPLRGVATAGFLAIIMGLVLVTAGLGLAQLWRAPPVSPVPPTLAGQDLSAHLNALDEAGISNLESYAWQRLEVDSLDPEALQYLGLAAGLRKDAARQEALALIAARISQRDPRTKLAALAIALQKRQYPNVLVLLDGLLRARPELGPQFFSVLASVSAEADGMAALANTLAETPPWRGKFIGYLIAQPEGWRVAHNLFGVLRAAGNGATAGEMNQLLSSLAASKSYEQAYFIWLDSLDENGLSRVQGVFDGGFDLVPENHLFDWNIRAGKNQTVTVLPRPGSSVNRALKVDLFGHHGRFSNVFQYLRLAPGQYVLRYDVMVQSLDGTAGLAWRLRCPDEKRILAETREINAVGPWSPANLLVTIPEDCPTQMLQLESAARAGKEPVLTGTFHFDDIRIEPVEGAAPSEGGSQQ